MASPPTDTDDLKKLPDGKSSTEPIKKEKLRKKTGKTKGEKLRNIGLEVIYKRRTMLRMHGFALLHIFTSN